MAADRTDYGEAWVYESIVGALPGVDVPKRVAIAIQLVGFETAILVLGWYYDLPAAMIAGTVAVAVAGAGSGVMLRLGDEIRGLPAPEPYRRLLFGSSVEVVLGVLAFVALVTHLFVFDPQQSTTPLMTRLFGEEPPVVVVYLTLLVLWDVAYRIGTSWWACVVAAWRSYVYDFDDAAIRGFRRVDSLNVVFGVVQLALLPFVLDQPVLAVVVGGHVTAVTAVSVLSMWLIGR